ncbi:50S ribosomal protein L25/general stress protein Ctc, partial [Methylobacterium radiotolerans]
ADVLAGGSIHLADIKLPMGVTYVPHGGEDNPLLAAAVTKGGAAAADEAEEAAPAA